MELIINCTHNQSVSDVWYYIRIYDRCGRTQFATNTRSETVRVCCCENSLEVSVGLYRNGALIQTFSRFVNCAREKQISMNFDFIMPSTPPTVITQHFVLLDKVYHLPINSAQLLFTSPR